jgi:hypothetical protein
MTKQIVANGPRLVTREEIIARGKVPVSPGVSQEQSEVAYWRRRVVEACIYGVDINPMAVELAKLSLWLTCIAAEEPLNFLDHHLREGNALLYQPTPCASTGHYSGRRGTPSRWATSCTLFSQRSFNKR